MQKTRNISDQPETISKVLEIIRNAGKPVSVEYVSYNSGLSWYGAKALLFRLVSEGHIKATDTTKSWIFALQGGETKEEHKV